MEKRFPDKDEAKILIGCSNGRKYSMDALMALDEAGYTNIVGLKGGYYAWNRCLLFAFPSENPLPCTLGEA